MVHVLPAILITTLSLPFSLLLLLLLLHSSASKTHTAIIKFRNYGTDVCVCVCESVYEGWDASEQASGLFRCVFQSGSHRVQPSQGKNTASRVESTSDCSCSVPCARTHTHFQTRAHTHTSTRCTRTHPADAVIRQLEAAVQEIAVWMPGENREGRMYRAILHERALYQREKERKKEREGERGLCIRERGVERE